MLKVKICGITQTKEAEYLNEAHADFAGMVMFYKKSKRNIEEHQAEAIIKTLSKDILPVAVTVSPDVKQLKKIENLGFSYIQIHGELKSEVIEAAKLPILRAFNVKDMYKYEKLKDIDKIAGYVFDAFEPGSGEVFDWSLLKKMPRDNKFLFLAGGLTPQNVADAVHFVMPDGVDVSSGVEYEMGGKSREKIIEFIKNTKE